MTDRIPLARLSRGDYTAEIYERQGSPRRYEVEIWEDDRRIYHLRWSPDRALRDLAGAEEKHLRSLSGTAARLQYARSVAQAFINVCYDTARVMHQLQSGQSLDTILAQHNSSDAAPSEAGMTAPPQTHELAMQPNPKREQMRSPLEGPESPETFGQAPSNHEEGFAIPKNENVQNDDGRELLARLVCGRVRGSVWLNHSEAEGKSLRASIGRAYSAEDGTTRLTPSYDAEDLDDVIQLAQKTRQIVQEESLKRGLEQPKEVQRLKMTR